MKIYFISIFINNLKIIWSIIIIIINYYYYYYYYYYY